MFVYNGFNLVTHWSLHNFLKCIVFQYYSNDAFSSSPICICKMRARLSDCSTERNPPPPHLRMCVLRLYPDWLEFAWSACRCTRLRVWGVSITRQCPIAGGAGTRDRPLTHLTPLVRQHIFSEAIDTEVCAIMPINTAIIQTMAPEEYAGSRGTAPSKSAFKPLPFAATKPRRMHASGAGIDHISLRKVDSPLILW